MTGDAPRRDESVSFSLRELTKLEDDRVDRERRDREQREMAERSAREAAARAADDVRRAQERAETAARETARKRQLDELAQRDAMQRALIEQTRVEVEARTRAEEHDRERRHDLELARLRLEGQRSQPGVLIGSALVGAAVMLAACVGGYFGLIKPASDRHAGELVRLASEGESKNREFVGSIAERDKTIASLRDDLKKAQADLATRPLAAPQATPTAPKPWPSGKPLPKRDPAPSPRACTNPNDPWCGM